jgi:transcription initiation factor TFIID subunit 5
MVSTPARKDDAGGNAKGSTTEGGSLNASNSASATDANSKKQQTSTSTQPDPSGSVSQQSLSGASSTPGGLNTPNTLLSDSMTPSQTSAVLSYFKKRGFKKGEDTLRAEIEALTNGQNPQQARSNIGLRFGSPSVSLFDLAVKSAPREPNSTNNANGTSNGSTSSPLGQLEQAAVQALMLDPTDRSRGFSKLRNWCEGSLEIYLPELQPLLLPLFVHSYLDLIDLGFGAAASAFYTANSWTFLPQHAALLADLRFISLPSHVADDPIAQRFRSERFVIKMTSTVFSLLLGWLTDGSGPAGGAGAGEGVGDDGTGEHDRRAREAMLKIINERMRVQVIDVKSQQLSITALEEGTGLTGAGPAYSATGFKSRKYPALQSAVVSDRDAVLDYNQNAAGPQLKLGADIPLSEKLQTEVEREVEREVNAENSKQGNEQNKASTPNAGSVAPNQKGLLQPTYSDLPPQAPVYRVIDIEREVAKVRDARKALRFNLSLNATTGETSIANLSGPSFMSNVRDASFNAMGEEGAKAARIAALPSICSYTYHDADDGLTCSKFSPDLSLMAAGFEESYVQIWSLKGEPLRGLRNDFTLSQVRDRKALDRHRERTTQSTRKLIGHSGPVYGVSFDPIGGSAAPPRHLLSASADSTVRLWSLETFTALVAYRGHQQPVWDVEWSPLGLYFATVSADKTARLWSTERVNPLRMYAGHLSDVDCLNFHPNSLYLATGSSDRSCRLWDVQRGACVRLFVGHQSAISCVKVSPDGRYLASAGAGNSPTTAADGNDCSISIWDLGSGKRIKKMWGHSAPILSMDFSVDGSMLVSSSSDCQIRCWDVRGAGGVRKHNAFGSSLKSATMNDGPLSGNANGGAQDPIILADGQIQNSSEANEQQSSADCITTMFTKQTPMLDVHFTPRNLCLTAGAFDASVF